MKYNAYWVNNKSEIYSVDITHIDYIINNPEKFGMTKDYIQKIYDKYENEKIGQEGMAREDIMLNAMKNGWIRIRKYKNQWIIQSYTLNNKVKDNIWDFANFLLMDKKENKYSEFVITAIHPEYYIRTTLEDIIRGNIYEANEYIKNRNKIDKKLNELNIKLKSLIKEDNRLITTEVKTGRIWKYITDENSTFGIISAFRNENSNEDNKKLTTDLIKDIRLKYGYIMLRGGFVEDGIEVTENSLFVPNIKRDEIVKLGIKYNQYSIIHKDNKSFVEISTNDSTGIGKVLHRFSTDSKDSLIFTKELVKNYFSSLMYGPHSDRKFLFKLKERELSNFNRIAYDKTPLRWETILEEIR